MHHFFYTTTCMHVLMSLCMYSYHVYGDYYGISLSTWIYHAQHVASWCHNMCQSRGQKWHILCIVISIRTLCYILLYNMYRCYKGCTQYWYTVYACHISCYESNPASHGITCVSEDTHNAHNVIILYTLWTTMYNTSEHPWDTVQRTAYYTCDAMHTQQRTICHAMYDSIYCV